VLGELLDWPLVGVDWVEEGEELEELARLSMSGLGRKWKERRGAYCWCWSTRMGVTTATARMAAATMRNVQILFQLAMLGSGVCS